jgi:Glycosyl transferase family 11
MNNNEKVCIRLMGQLGNQLFQLALALNISARFKVNILLDDYLATRKGIARFLFEEFSVFNYFQYCSELQLFTNRLQHNSTVRKFYKLNGLFIEAEHGGHLLDLNKPYGSYTGFFQSPSFFPEKDVLIKAFSLRDEFICEPLLKLLHLTETRNCLAVSVRRGDFLNFSDLGVCSSEYYINGINFVCERKEVDCIFVFSDDIPYCREILASVDHQVIYIEGFSPAKFLYLMSQCKHFVIANSTFSWWGAWLANHKEKLVVRPEPWNNRDPIAPDLLPIDWVGLPKALAEKELTSSQFR